MLVSSHLERGIWLMAPASIDLPIRDRSDDRVSSLMASVIQAEVFNRRMWHEVLHFELEPFDALFERTRRFRDVLGE